MPWKLQCVITKNQTQRVMLVQHDCGRNWDKQISLHIKYVGQNTCLTFKLQACFDVLDCKIYPFLFLAPHPHADDASIQRGGLESSNNMATMHAHSMHLFSDIKRHITKYTQLYYWDLLFREFWQKSFIQMLLDFPITHTAVILNSSQNTLIF